jgi:lambda family phage tail tape measure protein
MGNETVTVGVKIVSNTEEETKKAKGYRAVLEDVKKIAGGTSGSRNISDMGESAGYAQARAAVGTGAAGRDFAKQAQGLGGLVHVYATFAANLFAVGAAFRALSDAADTANMVKGLDQLGASSGKSLGYLSKQLVDTTDGAISLKEAMTSVAQASAAGMGSANILRLGEVAKKTSQALGIGMSDAVSRLSRGITKIEPELLDELGIFVKVDTASQNYARSLGKTASSLTDFEKRQGFANEVLSQAEEKFGKIKIDANPYDKLLASISNLATKGLELINVVLVPLISFLSKSPIALTGVLATIGSVLLKQAIPAIGQYREALKQASEEALLSVAGKSSAAAKALKIKKDAAIQEADQIAEVFVTARDQATAKFTELTAGKFAQSKKRVSGILDKGIYQVTAEDIKYLEDQSKKNINRNAQLAASYQEIADVIKGGQTAERNTQIARAEGAQAALDLQSKAAKTLKEDAEFKALSQKAVISQISERVAATTKEVGALAGLKQGYVDIMAARKGSTIEVPIPGQFVKNEKGKFVRDDQGKRIQATQKIAVEGLTTIGTAAGLANVGISAATTGLGKLLGKLSITGIAIGIAVESFQFLNSLFSSSVKEQEAFSKSSEYVRAALENVGKTIDALREKKFENILSIESVQARANAFNELSDSLGKNVKAADDLNKKQKGSEFLGFINWDRSIEGVQRFFSAITPFSLSEKIIGGGARSDLATNLSGGIIAAIKAAESGPARDKITKELSNLVGFDASTLDSEGLKKALDSLDFNTLVSKGDTATKIIKKFSDEANNNASTLTGLQDSLKQTGKDLDNLMSGLTPTDPLGKIGVDLIANSTKLNAALKDPTNSLLALKAVVDDPKFMSLLPASVSDNLLNAKSKIDGITASLGAAREGAQKAKEELARIKLAGKDTSFQEAAVKRQEGILADVEARAKEAAQVYSKELTKATFESAFTYLEASLKNAMQEGAIAAAKGYLSVLSGAGGPSAKGEAALQKQEFELQKSLIQAQYSAREALERNTLTLEKRNLVDEQRTQTDLLAAAMKTGDMKLQDEALSKLKTVTHNMLVLEEKSKFLANPSLKTIQGIQSRTSVPGQEDIQKEAAAQMSSYITALYGKQAQLAKISGQEKAAEMINLAKIYKENATEANKLLDIDVKSANLVVQQVTEQERVLGIYDEQLAKRKANAQQTLLELNYNKENNIAEANLAALYALEGKFAKNSTDETDRKTGIQTILNDMLSRTKKLTQDTADLESKATEDKRNGLEEIAKRLRDNNASIKASDAEIFGAQLANREIELSYRKELGLITEEQAAQERASIDTLKLKSEYEVKSLELANKKLDLTKRQGVINDIIKTNETLPEYERTSVTGAQTLLDSDKAALDKQKEAFDAVTLSKQKSIDMTKDLGSEMAGFGKIVGNAFQGMADALVEFAKTGKLDFAGLINSMIADLARFALRAQMTKMFESATGPGGFLSFLNPASALSPAQAVANGVMPVMAKGGAYDMGIQAFAQGGAFTNSIVNSPTLFKFAQGTGMMGEAGPEAIMPLKRDANGNLGVRTGNQGTTSVVVNNYGTEQATTKETTDSKGNRRIEVIIGEAVAKEVGRANSPVNGSLRANFQLQPNLVRR